MDSSPAAPGSPSPISRGRAGWALVGPTLGLLGIAALFRASQNAAQTTAPLLGHQVLLLGPGVIGLVVTVGGLAAVLTNLVLVGRRSHRGLGVLLGVGLSLLTVSLVVLATATSLPEFVAAALGLGAAGGLVMPVLPTLLGSLPGIDAGRSMAMYSVALSASLAAGPLLESGVLRLASGSLPAGLLAFVPLGALAIALTLVVRPGGPVRAGSFPGPAPTQPVHGSERRPARTRLVLRGNRRLRWALTSQLLYQVPFVAVVAFGALLARDLYGVSVADAQLGFTVFFLASLAARLVLVWHPAGERSVLVLRGSAVLTLAGVGVLASGGAGRVHGTLALFLAMGLLGVPHGTTYPVSLALVAQAVPLAMLARANSMLAAATNLVGVTGPVVLGALIEQVGYRGMMLLVGLPVLALGIALFVWTARPPSVPPEPEVTP
ncbi:MAG: MFS transporter [Actinomycetes bacterium]